MSTNMESTFWPEVLQVVPTRDQKLFVYFNDGSVRLFDVSPLIKPGTVFAPLADPDYFCSRATVIKGLEESGIRLVPQPCRIPREAALERVRRWRGFLYGGDVEPTTGEPTGDNTGETTVKTTEEEEPVEAVKEQTSPGSPPAEQVVPSLLSLTEVSYTLKGLDTGSLAALLSTLPLPRAPFTVTLTVAAEPLRAGVEAG